MGIVTFNMSLSLDGLVAGRNATPENGLGEGGARLFDWYEGGEVAIPNSGGPTLHVSPASAAIIQEGFGTAGAMVTGRKTFEIARGWGGEPPIAPLLRRDAFCSIGMAHTRIEIHFCDGWHCQRHSSSQARGRR